MLAAAQAAEPLPPVTVTATREPSELASTAGNVALIDADAIALVAPRHAGDIARRAPGAWITHNSGQESLVAIRSPLLTGAGACGAYLVLEDGIPIRPSGFCNVNQLFETQFEQAARVEVLRGPAGAAWGANALHGLVNVVMPAANSPDGHAAVDAGPDDALRGRFGVARAGESWAARLTGLAERDGGWRADSGYEQYKVNGAWQAGEAWRGGFGATRLRQETAGFIEGFEAYRDESLRRSNPDPEAWRDADSLRGWAQWRRVADARSLSLTPYARSSEMAFLQHFLPGQPVEENGQTSAGLQLAARRPAGGGALQWGVDLEGARGWLTERQRRPASELPPADAARRPVGRHYDYEVDARSLAPWAEWQRPLAADWTLGLGLRAERLAYDYDNRMLAGDTREDGMPCPGGCLFSRPADRSDTFTEFAPKLSLAWSPPVGGLAWLTLRRGFRPPQATELYRLQSGQAVAELDSETLDAVEIGHRGWSRRLDWELAAYWMEKSDVPYRDGEGFNVSGGKSRHVGLELALGWALGAGFRLELDGSLARHSWRFDRDEADGEAIVSGRDVDAAPRRLASTRLAWTGAGERRAELEWVHVGEYWLDAANTRRYPGHDVLHLRVRQGLPGGVHAVLRIENLADADYAERADFAFGDYRYLPGRGRAVFLELGWGR